MSSSATKLLLSPAAKIGIQKLQHEIFGQLPQLNVKTGYKTMKRMHRGAYIARYYPASMDRFAKMVSGLLKGWKEGNTVCFVFRFLMVTIHVTLPNLVGNTRLSYRTRRTKTREIGDVASTRKRTSQEGSWKEEEVVAPLPHGMYEVLRLQCLPSR